MNVLCPDYTVSMPVCSAYLPPLTAASIAVTLLKLPPALRTAPWAWNANIHGNISITAFLFSGRYALSDAALSRAHGRAQDGVVRGRWTHTVLVRAEGARGVRVGRAWLALSRSLLLVHMPCGKCPVWYEN
jgi:hypothetical protein